ncbi:MAG: sulfatase-like hydrolase/transferase, partial [Candidatus Omnitrophica bacterium]|nr:sulfatase-like hydrolase/transferase [Candidatus Omnitrophota bacterium]
MLRKIVLIALALLWATSGNAKDRPNVLVLIADDHAPYVYGAYGNDKAKTPNLDRLAEQGVRFTRAFVNAPFCTASRQSMLTGTLPHSNGVTRLTTPLSDDTITLAEVFKDQGYRTAAIGKMHFNSNLKHGFDLRLDHAEHRQYLKEHPPKPVPEGMEVL